MAKKEVTREAHYKNIINKQKRIIQELKKKIGRAGKIEDRYFDLEDREAELEELVEAAKAPVSTKPRENSCPKCNSTLDIIDGTRIKVYICPCGYRASKRGAG